MSEDNCSYPTGDCQLGELITKLQSDLKKAVEALEFYGNQERWNPHVDFYHEHTTISTDDVYETVTDEGDKSFGGKLAKSVLKELRGDK